MSYTRPIGDVLKYLKIVINIPMIMKVKLIRIDLKNILNSLII